MKPANFDYLAPTSVSETLAMLSAHSEDSKLLAGGQTLVPALNMRLARPAVLIDLNGVGELAFIREHDGAIEVGSMTRQRTLERSRLLGEHLPIFARALPYVAHFQIRNRGTIGGSLAHNDPAAELPAVVAALDAVLTIAHSSGVRQILWSEFFRGMLTTALEPNELLLSVRLPSVPAGTGVGFVEVSRRHGDFALVGAVALLHKREGIIDFARLVVFGVADGPIRLSDTDQMLIGAAGNDATWRNAADLALEGIAATEDLHASATYRREVGAVVIRRVLAQAWDDAYAGHA